MAQHNPTSFDPDQFKQEILDAVQQELNNFAQNFQTGQPGQQFGLVPVPPMQLTPQQQCSAVSYNAVVPA